MQAAVEHGIKKVIHTGPQFVRRTYDHDFDIADVPPVLTTGYYCLTKGLGERDLPDVCAGAWHSDDQFFVQWLGAAADNAKRRGFSAFYGGVGGLAAGMSAGVGDSTGAGLLSGVQLA